MEIRPALTPEMVKDLKILVDFKELEKALRVAAAEFVSEISENHTLDPIQRAKRLLDQSECPRLDKMLLTLCDALCIELPRSIIGEGISGSHRLTTANKRAPSRKRDGALFMLLGAKPCVV